MTDSATVLLFLSFLGAGVGLLIILTLVQAGNFRRWKNAEQKFWWRTFLAAILFATIGIVGLKYF